MMIVSANDKDEVNGSTTIEHEIIRTESFDNPDKLRKIYGNHFEVFKNMYLNALYVWVDDLETKILQQKEEEKELQAKLAACQSSSKENNQAISIYNQAECVKTNANIENSRNDKELYDTTAKSFIYDATTDSIVDKLQL